MFYFVMAHSRIVTVCGYKPNLIGANAASPTLVVKTENCLYIKDLKTIKNVKRCRDGLPKSMQTR